jgi:hypothetical protein
LYTLGMDCICSITANLRNSSNNILVCSIFTNTYMCYAELQYPKQDTCVSVLLTSEGLNWHHRPNIWKHCQAHSDCIQSVLVPCLPLLP